MPVINNTVLDDVLRSTRAHHRFRRRTTQEKKITQILAPVDALRSGNPRKPKQTPEHIK